MKPSVFSRLILYNLCQLSIWIWFSWLHMRFFFSIFPNFWKLKRKRLNFLYHIWSFFGVNLLNNAFYLFLCIKLNFYGFFFCVKIDVAKHLNPSSFIPHLYQDLPPIGNNYKLGGKPGDGISGSSIGHDDSSSSVIPSFGSKLGLLLPDPAPDVAPNPDALPSATTTPFGIAQQSK